MCLERNSKKKKQKEKKKHNIRILSEPQIPPRKRLSESRIKRSKNQRPLDSSKAALKGSSPLIWAEPTRPVNQSRSFVYSGSWIGCLWNFRAMKSFSRAAEASEGGPGCRVFNPRCHVRLKDRALSANDERRLRLPSGATATTTTKRGGKTARFMGRQNGVAFSIEQTRGN